jgi:hypothetical protein
MLLVSGGFSGFANIGNERDELRLRRLGLKPRKRRLDGVRHNSESQRQMEDTARAVGW